ncbi:hypothetical protein EKO27_g2922 [Xylaria grammica]|uniref:HNH nuclease domain-containing protein n=1 Tax=Xylaria grammica TaxID=363999 RepID=A0A439DCN6_9PEZI|nr:hypothetical protein EKO27_g2922 [Xylaria grammica]
MASSPLHRHQSLLENAPYFSPDLFLDTELRGHASHKLYSICEHFDTGRPHRDFSRPRLIRYTYTYSLSQESRDYFLRAFFQAVDLRIDGNEHINFEAIRSKFFDFGDYLFNNFFLPVKACTRMTPQPSQAPHFAVQEAQSQDEVRLLALQRDCLIRDRHRCVISRRFDCAKAMERRNAPNGAQDDEGNLLENDPDDPEFLEVAHILPHLLTRVHRGEPGHPRKYMLAILNMLDVGVAELIQSSEIDRSRNALTLTAHYHRSFRDFQVYFEQVPDKDHIYTIKTFYPEYLVRRAAFPITRELYLTPDRNIEPPSRRLLALHCAIAHILPSPTPSRATPLAKTAKN